MLRRLHRLRSVLGSSLVFRGAWPRHRSECRSGWRSGCHALSIGFLLLGALSAPPVAGQQGSGPANDVPRLEEGLKKRAAALRDRALGDEVAYRFVEELTTEVGARFAGTESDRRAVDWAVRKLEALGFDNVRAEAVQVPRWVRGHAKGEIVAPYPQPVALIALGGSDGTPDGGLEAEVLEVADLADLEARSAAEVQGKIVYISQRMRRTPDGTGYGEAVGKRVTGASKAAALGAVAVLIRSAGTDNNRFGHTGTMRYADGVRRIPAAALSNPDADTLSRQVASGKTVRFRLDLGARHLDPVMSANVIAEVVGREAPDEIVLLAAHLDSWDVGTGAHDDASGCGIVSAAAHLIAQMPQRPRRTLRVFLAANEEFGLSGARAYAERHADTLAQHVAAFESDLGGDRVRVMRSRVAPGALPLVEEIADLLAPLGIEYESNEARGGADLSPLRPHGVPLFDLSQDASRYFDLHHTENDTFDKIDPEQLAQNVAAYATLAYVLAEVEADFRPMPELEPRR